MMRERLREKSSFAVTCNLLSQYIKEKGGLGDLGLGIAKAKSETFPPTTVTVSMLPGVHVSNGDATTTMDLFPQNADVAADVRNPEKAQLTIFYGGKVLVFDDFPSEKAMDLMQLASKGSSMPLSTFTVTDHNNSASSVDPPAVVQPQRPPQPNTSYLPIARKASLHRFLEKRKDRIAAKGPYQVNVSKGKPEETEPWLGLGPRIAKPAPIKLESAAFN